MSDKLFPSQQPDEKILLIVREHWIRLFLKLIIITVLMALPLLVHYLLNNSVIALDNEVGTQVLSLLKDMYYVVLLFSLFIVWVLYYLNLHIVSEKRIVDIDQVGLLNHRISELNLETIEDVSSQTTGLFGNIFDYGTVFIQTAGASERFQFENVPHPAHIANIILTLYEQERNIIPKRP